MKTSVISDEFRNRYLSNPDDPNAFEGRAIVFDGPEDYHNRIEDPKLNIDENSKNKLANKNCDWIVANDVSNKKIGFDSEYNEVKIFQRNKPNIEKISVTTKEMIARKLVEKISYELKADG